MFEAMRRAKHFLPSSGVAPVAGAVGPDLPRLREVDDVLLPVAGPGYVLLSRRERGADGVHARHDALSVVVDLREDGQTDAGHDAHVDDDVRRVGELHADLRHGRADWSHAERQHVHGPPAHGAVEQLLELASHQEGVFPVVGGAGRLLRVRADEGAVFHPRHVAGVGSGVVTARPQFLVELDEAAALDHLAQSASYSSWEPSTQWTAAGCVSRAIFSTHLRRWAFVLSGTVGALLSWKGLMPFAFPSPIASQSLGKTAVPGRGRRDRRLVTAASSPATTFAPLAAGPTPARIRDRGAAAPPDTPAPRPPP